jgi:hypothetical protein
LGAREQIPQIDDVGGASATEAGSMPAINEGVIAPSRHRMPIFKER